ncbi:MAG: hypothetical protein KGH66_01210 [Candidatus Micrarchaeota archaeon]|nr:hypothetical protein [Candidatus Micrarchaeota archaeon]
MRQDNTFIAVASVATVSIACSLFYNLFAGILLSAIASLFLFFILRHWKRKDPDRELLRLVTNVVELYTKGRDTISLLMDSTSPNMSFYEGLVGAIKEYKLSGDSANAFFTISGSQSEYLKAAIGIIVNSLDNGANLYEPMKELRQRMEAELSVREKILGSVSGASAVIRFGSVLFLPIFSGISLDILGFAATVNSSVSAISPMGFILVLSLFMLASNSINFRYMGGSAAEKAAKAVVCGSVAIAVFKVTAALALTML